MGFSTFHDIVKLLTMCGESKSGLSTYYIKFHHGKIIFDHMLDRIGQMYLNGISSINIIGFRKSLKKQWHNNYEFLTWKYGKHHLEKSDMDRLYYCTFAFSGNSENSHKNILSITEFYVVCRKSRF